MFWSYILLISMPNICTCMIKLDNNSSLLSKGEQLDKMVKKNYLHLKIAILCCEPIWWLRPIGCSPRFYGCKLCSLDKLKQIGFERGLKKVSKTHNSFIKPISNNYLKETCQC